MSTQELKHYGVLGMKWGISRSKEVKGVRKAYRDQKRAIGDRFNKHFENMMSNDKRLRVERKQAIKDAKRNGGRDAVRSVKEDYKKKYKSISDNFDKEMDRLGKDSAEALMKFKSDRAAARTKASDRLFKDGDSDRNHRIANMNLGKAILQSFLMGSYGAKKYNTYRSKNQGRLKSGVKGLLWGVGNGVGYQVPSAVSTVKFAGNYAKDVASKNPEIRKLKKQLEKNPEVRKLKDKLDTYKSNIKSKIRR